MTQHVTDRPQSSQTDNDCLNLDEEIRARVGSALIKSAYYSVRHITCSMDGGLLTLSGRVPSFYLKQMAQTAAIEVLSHPIRINNQLEVGRG